MKTFKLSALILAFAVSGGALLAQETAPAAVPAPAPPVINGVVYVAMLPTPTQLMKDAAAENVTVSRMEPTADRVLVTYQYANGTTRTYAYLPLSAAGTVPVQSASNIASIETVPAPPTTIVYTNPQRIYYSDYPRYTRYYDPWDFWGPVTLGVGLGFIIGDHGGYHGGFRGGHRGWHH